jgi:hypothetical protein
MRQSRILIGSLIALSVGLAGLVGWPGRAVQLSNGTVYFNHPPLLVRASTTQNAAYIYGATYYFELNLSEKAGEPLGKVVISPEPSLDNVDFELEKTEAFEGNWRHEGAALPIKNVIQDPHTQAIAVTFDPPVPPGRTISIGLRPERNPFAGVYLFGVTAFPAGEVAYGQFLGYGRIQIYERGGIFW